MPSKFIVTFRVPVCLVVVYFCSGYIFAFPCTVVYLLLELLRPLMPNAHLLSSEWTFLGVLSGLWFLYFILGISGEVLKYAGWRLMKVLRKREDSGEQKYRILAERVWWAADFTLRWTMYSYVSLFTSNREVYKIWMEKRRGMLRPAETSHALDEDALDE